MAMVMTIISRDVLRRVHRILLTLGLRRVVKPLFIMTTTITNRASLLTSDLQSVLLNLATTLNRSLNRLAVRTLTPTQALAISLQNSGLASIRVSPKAMLPPQAAIPVTTKSQSQRKSAIVSTIASIVPTNPHIRKLISVMLIITTATSTLTSA